MLSVSAPQQVMLEVKIAEVSKTLLERLEAGTTLKFNSGSWATTLLSNFLTGTASGLLDARKTNGNQLTLEAQKQDGLVRILAEPTVMAISGQEGSFLAGGKIFIPVAQDNNRVTLEEKEFGVGLRFTPTVLSGGRINLRVAPEVSEISREGIGISAAGFTGGADPAVDHDPPRQHHRPAVRRPELRHRRPDQEQPGQQPEGHAGAGRSAGAGRAVPQHRLPAGPYRAGVRGHGAPGQAVAAGLHAADRQDDAGQPHRVPAGRQDSKASSRRPRQCRRSRPRRRRPTPPRGFELK